jgi:hypothetical protein
MNDINLNSISEINSYLDFLETIPVEAGVKIHQESLDIVSELKFSFDKPLDSLFNRIVSLRYRMNLEERGEVDPVTCQSLDPCIPNKNGKLEKIEEVSRYALFSHRLLSDKNLLEEFIQWSIVFGNDVRPFVEFPAIVRKITQCGLACRIGFYGGKALRVVEGKRKLLTLPFEGIPLSILNEDAWVKFSKNYQLRIRDIYQIFHDRLIEMGNLEFLPSGICNWNPKKLGSYNSEIQSYDIEYLNKEDWWHDLPYIENLTIEQAQGRYNLDCDGQNWVFTVKASRERPTTDVVGTHSYLEVAIPYPEGYVTYYFGKFSIEAFPVSTLQYLNCITSVTLAAVCYPDENIFNLNREHASHSALATEAEGLKIMRSIKKDIFNSMHNNFYFQLVNENCCRWVWKKLRHHLGDERIPNLFGMVFSEIEAEGAVGAFFEKLRSMTPAKRKALLNVLFFSVAGWRSRKVIKKNGSVRKVGVFHSPTWKPPATFLHPPMLFYK